MIAGLCESPLTFQAIIIWRDELNEGKVFLRDIIDLEATYAGPGRREGHGEPGRARSAGVPARRLQPAAWRRAPIAGWRPRDGGRAPVRAARRDPVPRRHRPPRQRAAAGRSGGRGRRRARAGEGDMDDDDMENSLSLAAIEAELKPKVMEAFDKIANEYKRLRRLQDQDIANQLQNESLSPAQERKYKKIKEELVAEVKSLRLNQARIDALVEQLYDINKRLISLRRPPDAACRKLRRAARGLPAQPPGRGARTRSGSTASRSSRPRAGRTSSRTTRTASSRSAPTSRRSRPRPASRSASSARSSTWCRRASARRARPRRKWSRRTCASSSRSPRNTPTAACSSSTSSRKATSA